jgi:hypothetical protein
MRRLLLVLVALLVLAGALAGCGATPEPTEPPPTQTPWIVIITATAGSEVPAEVQPTQTPWIIVATPTPAEQAKATEAPAESPTEGAAATEGAVATEEPTGEAAPTMEPPPPTDTPDVEGFRYPPPALLEPPDARPVSWKNTVLLTWSSVGDLGEDEYYHLHLERRPEAEGQEWYGDYVYTRENEYLAEAEFLAPFHPPAEYGKGMVHWWVRVVRKTGEDENGKPVGIDISAHSEERTLILDSKPD